MGGAIRISEANLAMREEERRFSSVYRRFERQGEINNLRLLAERENIFMSVCRPFVCRRRRWVDGS